MTKKLMDESGQLMTRYLLGELSASEQAALEERYFTDPQVFDQVLRAESELVDNYVRGQLSTPTRERFEQSYLIHPRRRARVKFAEALATRLDQIVVPETAAAEQPPGGASRWQRLLMALRVQRPMAGFSTALISLLIVTGGLWFFIKSRQARQELAQTQAARASQEQGERELQQGRERELEQQAASERRRAEELTAEQEREKQRAQQQIAQTTPTPPVRSSAPTSVSLLLTVSGARGADAGRTQTLIIPPGTAQARLRLNLKENDYSSYSVSLQAVGGRKILSRQGLRPGATKSGASFVLTVPSHKFATGDYVLTLQGINQNGGVENVSKSIFRVEKR